MRNRGIPAANNEYLKLIGQLVYSQGYLEWALFDMLKKLDPSVNIENLAGREAGSILAQARQVANTQVGAMREALEEMCRRFEQAKNARNDVVHARPATDTDGVTQILYRWAPSRVSARIIQTSDVENAIDLVESALIGLARCGDILDGRSPRPI